ncbi:DNA polymerase I [Cytophagaceae bacterium ABcell3]|nr:DNA polymerase I [Cytophagaceae bacterium ABcell3]
MEQEKKLFLIDAMALIYRAHFAFSKNPRITSTGINTSAIFGFTNSLLEVLFKEKPSHIGVAIDTAAPTFRHENFKEYKANRQEQPEDISIAIPYVKKLLDCFNIPLLGIDGYEADDVIGTLSKMACKEGFQVYMMTMDKDYCQLVNDCVFLYKPSYMGNGVEVYDVNRVLERFNVEKVDQVRDILGLQGDASDNIPGIPGVGEKTAQKLIKEFGNVENLIDNAESLKGKLKERIIEHGAQGVLSKELATIYTEVPVTFDEEVFRYKGPDEEKVGAFCDELEFRTLRKRILGDGGETEKKPVRSTKSEGNQMSLFADTAEETKTEEEVVTAKDTIDTVVHDYHLMDTPELQEQLLEYLLLQKEVSFDTETTGLEAYEAEMIGIAFSYRAQEAYYVPVPLERDQAKQVIDRFKPFFENKEIVKIGQNLKYDLIVLEKYGVHVAGTLFDTMLAHYLIEPDMRHSMDLLAEAYLNYVPVSIESLIGKKGVRQKNMKDIPVDKVAAYAAEDADITFCLKQQLEPLLKEQGTRKLFDEVEIPLLSVLAEMECAGVKIDKDALKEFSEVLEKEVSAIEKLIYEEAGAEFNIASPKQLGEILFDKLKIDPKAKKTKKSGQYATGEEVLSKLAEEHTIARQILEYRELQKLKSTYVDALPLLISPRDGRIHTSYNQAVAATGRLSSTNPNLQNIPIRTDRGREIRKAFVPRNDDFLILAADYSQIELRIMASFSKEANMVEAFRQGRDIHTTTASKVYKVSQEEVTSEMRRKAKMVNFGIIYGISPFGLSQRLNIPRKEAADIIDAYFTEFPAIKSYMDEVVNFAREHQYVETILGRRRYLRDINSRNMTMRGYAERNAINAPIQGSAADMIKVAMVNIHEWLKKEKLQSKMVMQVHDELVFDVYKDEVDYVKQKVEYFMQNAISMEVPLEVGMGVGDNWLKAH